MFRHCDVRACAICGGTDLSVACEYRQPPKGEVAFVDAFEGGYRRSYFLCKGCGHFTADLEVDPRAFYIGNYVSGTYRDREGLRRNFERIRSLPSELSDNIGRVRHVAGFVRRYCDQKNRALKLLDIGAGLGVFPAAMKEEGFVCTALDPDPAVVEHLKGVVGVTAVGGVVEDVVGLGRFDVISLNKVLEHVNDPVKMLARCRTFLEGGGCVYIELPDGEGAREEGFHREEFFLEHLHVFTCASVRILAERAGFRVLAVEKLREPSGKYTLRMFVH